MMESGKILLSMNRFLVYFFLSIAFCLSACKEQVAEQQDKSAENFDSDWKLVVIDDLSVTKQVLSLRIPKDWSFREADHWERPFYYFVGPSNQSLSVYLDYNYGSRLTESSNESVFSVEKRQTKDSLNGLPVGWNIHVVGARLKDSFPQKKTSVHYFKFVYNPQESDSLVCERIVKTLSVMDSVPERAKRPIMIYSFTNVFFHPTITDFLCDGCPLQDSVASQGDTVKYFDCTFDSLTFRFISDSRTGGDTLSAVHIKKGKMDSLNLCRNALVIGIWGLGIGFSRDDVRGDRINEISQDHWVNDYKSRCWEDDCDSIVEHADLYFVNDMVDHLYFTRYKTKIEPKKNLKRKKAL